MNAREKRFLTLGLGAGLALALVIGGAVGAVEHRSRVQAAETAAAAAAAPTEATMDAGTMPGSTVQLTAADQKAAGVEIAPVRRQHLVTTVDAFGRVEDPEANLSSIPARVAGRVDKLYLQYTGQNVRRGQPIAEIYSPDLASTAEEYRLARESRARLGAAQPEAVRAADDLVAASRQRLELWGVTPAQIAQMDKGAPKLDVTVYSSASGTVIERKVTAGQYVNAGDTLYSVADLSTVWVKADVYEADLPQIRSGQPVEITSDALPGQTIHGSVEFIEPQATRETRTIPVHVHVANPGMRLRPGMFVRAVFAMHKADALVVPRSAVLDTGVRKLVYVARENGMFEAREVKLGTPSNDLFPVLDGVAEGESVVVNGNFLIDSQTRLKGGMGGMFGGAKQFTGHDHGSAAPAPEAAPSARLTFRTEPERIKARTPAVFHVRLTDAAGAAIPGAQVTVTLVMPAMPAMQMPEVRSSGRLQWNGSEYVGSVSAPAAGLFNVSVEAVRAGQVIASERARLRIE